MPHGRYHDHTQRGTAAGATHRTPFDEQRAFIPAGGSPDHLRWTGAAVRIGHWFRAGNAFARARQSRARLDKHRAEAGSRIQNWFKTAPGFEPARQAAREKRSEKAGRKIGSWFRTTPSFAPARKRARQRGRDRARMDAGPQSTVAGMQVGGRSVAGGSVVARGVVLPFCAHDVTRRLS